MEAATLSSPQRKFEAVPVQKSLSLPSYAKAGGEGIDHRIIFAALEQREKVRRKSKIFTREKSARQNIFCLPIPSGNKCRETSFSSDTSCSSLEYQKPKAASKTKKPVEGKLSKNDPPVSSPSEIPVAKTNEIASVSNSKHSDVPRNVIIQQKSPVNTVSKVTEGYRKDNRSPSNSLRPFVHSSDSMERSSRSSNDSLSRKERLVAIKAKVEAEREKYGDTSSEEENRGVITRYNSDGVIHRTVREVKSRSYRLEKRLRRRSQDEYGIRKAIRKNNLSLCLNSKEDGIFESSLNAFDYYQNLEVKTDFCPSPNFLDFAKKNYFSDFPNKENMTRMVHNRIQQIEEEERKRRNSVDFRDKGRISSRQSPQNTENSSPFSTQRRNVDNSYGNASSEKHVPSPDAYKCPSPIGRAPTPPPRSPKSMSFINKAFIQHQNSYLNHDSRSLERKPSYKPNIPVSKSADTYNKPGTPSVETKIPDDVSEKRQLMKARRKTCSYFDYGDFSFKDLSLKCDIPISSKFSVNGFSASSAQSSPKSPHVKGFGSSAEPTSPLSEDAKKLLWKTKWEETEKRQEYMFNSLESKRKPKAPLLKQNEAPQKNTCLCYILSGDTSDCNCNKQSKIVNGSPTPYKLANSSNYDNLNYLVFQESPKRASKAETNVTKGEASKLNAEPQFSRQKTTTPDKTDNLIATANLDSAMEELENIYRSLKISSETLSEKNSAPNSTLSLNDLNIETPKNIATRYQLAHPKPTPRNDNNFNLGNENLYNGGPLSRNSSEESQQSHFSRMNSQNSSCTKNLDSDNTSIDELFNDLTRQLDIEHKLLKESHKDLHSDKSDHKRMTPLESIVSIRKELYDNLQKNTHEQMRPYSPVVKGRGSPNPPPLQLAKKYKAVRSLSENISHLMGGLSNANSSPTSPRKSMTSRYEFTDCNFVEKASPKHHEHFAPQPPKVQRKRDVSVGQPVVPKRSFISERLGNSRGEEIRQIRVSMDSIVSDLKPTVQPEYLRLSTAVARQQVSPKSDTRPFPAPNILAKERTDVLDENGLEKLLSTLLNDVPDTNQSSLLLSDGNLPSTPPVATSAGKFEHVKHKRNILPSKMDTFIAAAAAESNPRLNPEEIAQVKNDFRQNTAHSNQMSFIPVYSNKTACHKFPKSSDFPCENQPEKKILTTYSPPSRPRYMPGNNDIGSRFMRTHMRRRSVGFEDMTSLCYGHNMSNDRRFQNTFHNSNIPLSCTENHSNYLNSGNISPVMKMDQSESSICPFNHNAQLTSGENANDHLQQRPSQRFKDKSSKRKSSLNRIDFIQFSTPATLSLSDPLQQRNSSSDEVSESKLTVKKSESPVGTSKRKHNVSPNHVASKLEVMPKEITLSGSSSVKAKSSLLPKSSKMHQSGSRMCRWRQPASIRLSNKLSHSAGELESLTDLSEVPSKNKTYLSAQEYDDVECYHSPQKSNQGAPVVRNCGSKSSPQHLSYSNTSVLKGHSCHVTSQDDAKDFVKNSDSPNASNDFSSLKVNDDSSQLPTFDQKETYGECSEVSVTQCPIICDSYDVDVNSSAIKLENLEISNDSSKNDTYLSAEESGDIASSDGERRRGSILRKKSFEEKKELHSILKPPPDDKLSKAPPSILKHRESSEEKESWPSNDLHSILKKSTSEDESCNSGPDIRPILKLSTDEDSPGGSVRPRPILKKRTSFSDECSYVSFSSNELKPILKKKTHLSTDDQPRPILKSRRKSEDTRSTISEVITSRPRAYSADMGVKMNHEDQAEVTEVTSNFSSLKSSHNL